MPLDKPSAGVCHGVKPTPQTPRPPKPQSQNSTDSDHKSDKKCNHLYRMFRVENDSGIIITIFFYCQKCLDIQIKKIEYSDFVVESRSIKSGTNCRCHFSLLGRA